MSRKCGQAGDQFLRWSNKKASPSKDGEAGYLFNYLAFAPVLGVIVIGGVLGTGNSLFDSTLNLSTGGVSYE